MVDLDIVKSMTDLCDGGALINGNRHIYKDVIDICVDRGIYQKIIIVAQRKRVGLITRRTVDRNNPMI